MRLRRRVEPDPQSLCFRPARQKRPPQVGVLDDDVQSFAQLG